MFTLEWLKEAKEAWLRENDSVQALKEAQDCTKEIKFKFKAYREYLKYRAIGTVEEFQQLKQASKNNMLSN